ncbi:MAG: hypothetical protein IM498_09790, partial [Microcystis sp. M064S2]|uniref:hypothetical protein n=1 Tax=Microcystis sp. M064S2 TaxID=2771172 RepID=UPI0025830795
TFYIIVGLLNIVIALGLFRISDTKSIIVGGKILLLVSGVIWTTFGLINYDPNTDFGNHLLAQRTIAILATGLLGLILIGAEMEKIRKDKFLKYFTLAAAGTMLLLSLLSVFVYWDETWIRTNISLTIYFVWFGVFGLRLVQKASAQHNVSAMVP